MLFVYWRTFCEDLCVSNLILRNLLGQQNSIAEKDFSKTSPLYMKQFVAASVTQFVLQPVHKKLFFAVTCCSNTCPSVFQPLEDLEISKKLPNHDLFHLFLLGYKMLMLPLLILELVSL